MGNCVRLRLCAINRWLLQGGSELKIITWNVNGIRSVLKKGFHDLLRTHQPDILGLQETKACADQLDEGVLYIDDYHSYWSSAQRRGYSGTAIYSKPKPQNVEFGIGIRKFDNEGRFVVADYGQFVLYNVYFPNGGSGDERHQFKQEFLVKFTRHLVRQIQAGREIILMGDYNVAYLDKDVFDPVRLSKISGFLPEEREWFQRFLKEGFTDAFRHFYPERSNAYTWWSYKENGRFGNRGWRIDHVSVTKGLVSRLKSCEHLEEITDSDHCPVVLELKD